MKQKEMNEEQMSEHMMKFTKSYSDLGFINKINQYNKQLGKKIVYYALVLHYMLKSPDTSWTTKAKVLGALGYLISPIDLIPDFIPIVGFSDDASVLIFTIHLVLKEITPDIKKQAMDKLYKWFKYVDEDDLYMLS